MNYEFRQLPVDAIRPNDYNPNRMTPGQFRALKQTIEKDGFVGVVLVNHTWNGYGVIDGEHRWRAARELGLNEIPCAVTHVPHEQAKALSIKLNQIHGDWVPDLLVDVVCGLPEPLAELGFAEGELDEMFEQFQKANAVLEETLDNDPFRVRRDDGERYIGFNLDSRRQQLLEQALEYASSWNQDQQNPRGGCLEVILRAYLEDQELESTRFDTQGRA